MFPRIFAKTSALLATFVLLVAGLLLFDACGAAIPKHDGYKNKRPWKNLKVARFLIEAGEYEPLEFEDGVSYPLKKRASWFKFKTPGDGSIELNIEIAQISARNDFDLAVEVLNQHFKPLRRKDKDDEDATSSNKRFKVSNIPEGIYYLHVYTQHRLDEAEFVATVHFTEGTANRYTIFPSDVPFVNALAIVPGFDDTPTPNCQRCSCLNNIDCRGVCRKCKSRSRLSCSTCKCSSSRSCKKVCTKCGGSPNKVNCASCSCDSAACKSKCKSKCENTGPTKLVGRIRGFSITPKGTRIKIDKGSVHGLTSGWTGVILNRGGARVRKSSFVVNRVGKKSSYVIVKLRIENVENHRKVELRAPAN